MVWLLNEKKIEDMFTRFDRIRERDRQIDRQTPHDRLGRACTASCGKNGISDSREIKRRIMACP